MSYLAVIDVGTNSVKLTIADASAGGLAIVTEKSKTTRLGEGVDQSKRLTEAAMDRTFQAVHEFATEASACNASRIAATGTSALRDASNGGVLLDRIWNELGLSVELISGNREAELAFRAVAADSSMGFALDQPLLIFDIGGGSTELICGTVDKIEANRSLDVGAVRLTERHLHSDPPTKTEYASARSDAMTQLLRFDACGDAPRVIGGVGGTAVNIAAVVHGTREVHAVTVTREQLQTTVALFLSLPLAQRKTIPYLEPDRAEIILGGAAILEELLDRYRAGVMRVSVRGMRYGLLMELAMG